MLHATLSLFLSFIFQEHYDRSGFASVKFGILFNLNEMAEFITILVSGKNQPTTLDEMKKVPKTKPLSEWEENDWLAARQNLVRIRKNMLRLDAKTSMSAIDKAAAEAAAANEGDTDDFSATIENAQENLELASGNKWFNEKFYKALKSIELHATLAPYRKPIEDFLESEMTDEQKFNPLEVPDDILKDYM